MGRNRKFPVLAALAGKVASQVSSRLSQKVNAQSGKILVAGLAGLAFYHWRGWQGDKKWLAQEQLIPGPVKLNRYPRVSVLVAAWNEEDAIEAHLNSFLALNYPDIELIVCAGGPDRTFELAQTFNKPGLQVLQQHPGEGKQAALARCLPLATGEIIYLTDADCLYEDETLLRLLDPLVNEAEQAVTGASRPLDEQLDRLIPAYLWAADTVAGRRSPRYVKGLLGRNSALWRNCLEEAGGLDFYAPSGTDYQLARRLLAHKVAIRYVKTSVIASRYPQTPGQYRRKQARWLRNLLYYGPRYGATEDVRATLKTIGLGNFMLALPLAAFILGPLGLVSWLLLVNQAVLARWRYLAFTAGLYRRKISGRLLAGAIPMTLLDFVVWSQPIFDLMIKNRRERW